MKTVIIVNQEGMGHGDEALARRLMVPFLEQVRRYDQVEAVILYNTGVRLAAEGSELLQSVAGLHEGGIEVLSCGTCVKALSLEGKIKAGRVSNMEEIVKTLVEAEKVVTL
ncbi:MAG: DsrE family protein [Candidatus Tectomicrobia bacterium]|nr:DsrE family protein [Candidatus Tectomicrobia bacterium]